MMCAHAFTGLQPHPHLSSPLMPPVRVTSWQDRFMIATQPYRVRWPATRAWWLVCVCCVWWRVHVRCVGVTCRVSVKYSSISKPPGARAAMPLTTT